MIAAINCDKSKFLYDKNVCILAEKTLGDIRRPKQSCSSICGHDGLTLVFVFRHLYIFTAHICAHPQCP